MPAFPRGRDLRRPCTERSAVIERGTVTERGAVVERGAGSLAMRPSLGRSVLGAGARGRTLRVAVLVTGAVWAGVLGVGCGAGTPLMHPAQVLDAHRVRAGAGASHHLTFGPTEDAIERARAVGAEPGGVSDSDVEAFVDGSVAHAVATPQLSPWVGARAGLGGGNEMGLSWTGRRVRGDLRHVFELDDVLLSVGGGLGAVLPDLGSNTPGTGGAATDASGGAIPRFDGGSISGWTVDVPLLLGTEAQEDVASAWIGVHALYERFSADLVYDLGPDVATVAPAQGSRVFAGAVAGVMLGLRPLWAVLELSGGYQRVSSEVTLDGTTYYPSLEGFTLTPSFALVADLD